jgi:hypothetical protein
MALSSEASRSTVWRISSSICLCKIGISTREKCGKLFNVYSFKIVPFSSTVSLPISPNLAANSSTSSNFRRLVEFNTALRVFSRLASNVRSADCEKRMWWICFNSACSDFNNSACSDF